MNHYGTGRALIWFMRGARHFKELIVWQLADRIRTAIYPLTQRLSFVRDNRLRTQTDDAIESVRRNIAEGFGCDSDAEFLRFLVFSRRSLNELFDSLLAAERKGHVRSSDLIEIRAVGRRLHPAMGGLMRHLRNKIVLQQAAKRGRSNNCRR
jgi:four helix bundle protein